jgi:hypothetical protein
VPCRSFADILSRGAPGCGKGQTVASPRRSRGFASGGIKSLAESARDSGSLPRGLWPPVAMMHSGHRGRAPARSAGLAAGPVGVKNPPRRARAAVQGDRRIGQTRVIPPAEPGAYLCELSMAASLSVAPAAPWAPVNAIKPAVIWTAARQT